VFPGACAATPPSGPSETGNVDRGPALFTEQERTGGGRQRQPGQTDENHPGTRKRDVREQSKAVTASWLPWMEQERQTGRAETQPRTSLPFPRLRAPPWLRLAPMAVVLGVLGGLWTIAGGQSAGAGIFDPFEAANRRLFAFNRDVEGQLLRPAVTAYRDSLPEPVRIAVGNGLHTLRAPYIFVNDMLQGEGDRAGEMVARFCVNAVLGLGIFDAATALGLPPPHNTDFARTLAAWGVPAGPYLIVPFLGPTTTREALGLTVGFIADPLNVYWRIAGLAYLPYLRSTLATADARSRLDDMLASVARRSLDDYAVIRSMYLQARGDGEEDASGSGGGYGRQPVALGVSGPVR
jgi:phospholipid-binding lipoprotein MlaA